MIDYVLGQQGSCTYLSSLNILDRDIYSDHCPLSLNLAIMRRIRAAPKHKTVFTPEFFVWDATRKGEYCYRLSDQHSRELQEYFLCELIENDLHSDDIATRFKSLLKYAISGVFK